MATQTAASAPAPSSPVPLSVFAELPATESPRINTDGTAIATRVRVGGRQALAVIPLDQPNPRPEIIAQDDAFDQVGGFRTIRWEWMDPDTLLIWVASRLNFYGDRVDAGRVIAYNRRTRRTTRLGWEGTFLDASDVIWRSTSGTPTVLIARYAEGRGTERLFNREVVRVDVTTGRHEVVLPPQQGASDWYADGAGNIRLGTSFDRDSGRLTALYRSGGTGNFRTIIRQQQERYAQAPVPLIFLPDEKALVLSRHSGFTGVYEIDLRTMEMGRQVFGMPGYDVGGIEPNWQRSGLQRASVIRDREEHHWFDPRMREIQQILDETYGAGRARIVSSDRAQQNLIVRVAAPNQAGAYYLYKTETGDVRQLGWANNTLRDAALNPVRTIRYRARDGKEIAAVLTLPRSREHRNLPLIVLPHGGPWSRDHETWDMWAQPLAELGYAVVQPNFRGSSGYGRDWEAASDGAWGMAMQDDLDDSVAHLAAQGIADRGRVCMFGWSYGGYAAARAAQRNPDLYRCAIAGAGVFDLPDMVAYDRNYLGRYGSQYIGSAASRLADISPARHTDGRWAPILIVHGARDERVPIAQARTLVRRLRASGKVEGRDFVFIEQPRNTHNLPLEEDRLQLLTEMQRFLARHNPAD